MKKCKSCKTDIDAKATKCPNCKADQRGWFRRHPILAAILILIVIGILGSAAGGGKTTSKTGSNSGNTTASVAVSEEPAQAIEVVTTDFIAEYDKNQLAAEKKYKGALIKLTAKIKNISEDIMGSPFLSLVPEAADQYYYGTSVQCIFEDKSQLTALANGQTVAVTGIADQQSLGIIVIKKCQVVE